MPDHHPILSPTLDRAQIEAAGLELVRCEEHPDCNVTLVRFASAEQVTQALPRVLLRQDNQRVGLDAEGRPALDEQGDKNLDGVAGWAPTDLEEIEMATISALILRVNALRGVFVVEAERDRARARLQSAEEDAARLRTELDAARQAVLLPAGQLAVPAARLAALEELADAMLAREVVRAPVPAAAVDERIARAMAALRPFPHSREELSALMERTRERQERTRERQGSR